MLIDIDDYLLGTRDQNGKYNFTSKYGLILNIKDQVSFGCHVSALLDCHRQTAIRQIHEFQFQFQMISRILVSEIFFPSSPFIALSCSSGVVKGM